MREQYEAVRTLHVKRLQRQLQSALRSLESLRHLAAVSGHEDPEAYDFATSAVEDAFASAVGMALPDVLELEAMPHPRDTEAGGPPCSPRP
jgi:hypothetical protein